jgi:hypothetical protein
VSCSCRYIPGERAPCAHWIWGWVDITASLDDMEKWKFWSYRNSKLRLLGLPARSQSVHRLRLKNRSHWNCKILFIPEQNLTMFTDRHTSVLTVYINNLMLHTTWETDLEIIFMCRTHTINMKQTSSTKISHPPPPPNTPIWSFGHNNPYPNLYIPWLQNAFCVKTSSIKRIRPPHARVELRQGTDRRPSGSRKWCYVIFRSTL